LPIKVSAALSPRQAQSIPVEGNAQLIKPIPIALATAYWLHEVGKGNVKAQAKRASQHGRIYRTPG
jgi:hypothetical protein